MSTSDHARSEGHQGCPVCAARVTVEPWAIFGDLRCEQCHTLLWYLHLEPRLRVFEHAKAGSIREQVIEFLSGRLGIDPEKLDESSFTFDDLGGDSLETIELVMKLEQKIDRS
jgi:acyl carrier protein